MVQAAKAMAGLGVKALCEPDLIAAARATSRGELPARPMSARCRKTSRRHLDMSLS
jgi:aminobenzoyl-glutamate utilization protein B